MPETPSRDRRRFDDLPTVAAGNGEPPAVLRLGGVSDSAAEQADWDSDDYPASEPGVYDIGHRHFIVPFGEAGYRWWHDCPAVEHVSWGWIGRVSADQVSGHRIVHHAPSLTVEGSLLCPDCGDHGFIRHNKWVAA